MTAQRIEAKKTSKARFVKSTFTLIVIIFATMLLARVVLFNVLATSGQRLAAANQQIEILKEENQKLENSISNNNSLSNVENFAKKSGFVKVDNIEVLTPSRLIANR